MSNHNNHQFTTNLIAFQSSPFDAIRKVDENSQEYWSARDLQSPLGYAKWQNFEEVIDKGKISCKNNGHNPDDHFTGVSNPIKSGKGGIQYIQDCHLSRLACYFTAMNGDPRKPEIAAAQGYFVVSTMENETTKPRPQELADLRTMFTVLQRQITESTQLSPAEQAIKDCLMYTGLKLTAGEIKINCMSLEVKRLLITVMDKLCDDMALRNTIRRQNPIGNQTAPRFFF
jgi:DNA-damage-inducible protein D